MALVYPFLKMKWKLSQSFNSTNRDKLSRPKPTEADFFYNVQVCMQPASQKAGALHGLWNAYNINWKIPSRIATAFSAMPL